MQTKTQNKVFANITAEAAVIGSMLKDNSVISLVTDIISEQDFFRDDLQLLFQGIKETWKQNGETDPVVVRYWLDNQNKETPEIIDLMIKCFETVPCSANAKYYADIVKTESLQRNLLFRMHNIQKDIENTGLSFEEKQKLLAETVMELKDNKDQTRTIEEVIKSVLQNILEEKQNGIHTGYNRLDEKIGGFKPGELIIMAGRPGMGKSALAINMLLNMSKAGKSIYFLSLEQSPESLTERIICKEGRINIYKLRGYRSKEDTEKIFDTGNQLAQRNVWIDGSPMITPTRILSRLMQKKSQHKIDVCFIDYLQLIQPNRKSESRQLDVTYMVAELKAAALKINIPIVLLCQLNRSPEQREDHIPRLSDLRESGSIEQDADVVLFLHRNDYYRKKDNGQKEDGIAEVVISKNRQGATGTIQLMWLAEFFSFENMTEY